MPRVKTVMIHFYLILTMISKACYFLITKNLHLQQWRRTWERFKKAHHSDTEAQSYKIAFLCASVVQNFKKYVRFINAYTAALS